MPINPNSVKWDDAPQLDASKIQWDEPASPGAGFKSGEAFKDTKDMLGSIPELWEQFKKEWASDKTLDELSAEAKKSPEAKARIEAQLRSQVKGAHAAGSALMDAAGGVPAMAVGGIAGIASGVRHLDASKGLETGNKVMSKLMPSSLLGHEEDQQNGVYHAVMAPVTAAADAFNAVPTGYGEMLNAAGMPNAAQQVTDAGKLGIMAVLGGKGVMEAYKHATGKEAKTAEEAATKLEALLKQEKDKINPADVKWDKVNSASDRGIPPSEINPQGELFSQEHDTPTTPIASENQMEMFGEKPAPEGTINYEKTFPFDLVPKDEAPARTEMGLNMPEKELGMDLQADQHFMKLGENTWEPGQVGSRDVARAKAEERAKQEQFETEQAHRAASEKEAAYEEVRRLKETDFSKMEAQKELDFAQSAANIENSTKRGFFTEPNSREKLVRPEERLDSSKREFFLDPNNRDNLLDLHTTPHDFNHEVLGDKSMMAPEHTSSLMEAIKGGNIRNALDVIMKNHDSVSYRNLANYLKDKLDGINLRLYDEGVLAIGDKHATGYFDPATRTVGLSKVGAASPHTVLHELVHAMTSDFVNNRPNDIRVMGLKDLYNKLNALGMDKEFPNVSNVKEFLAEAFSNPEFQNFLKDHRVAEKSSWRRFVDNVKSILGFSASDRSPTVNALEHAMDLGKQVMDAEGASDKAILKDAGMPGKLADLMVSRNKRPEPVNTKVGEDVQRLKVPGLKSPISDFTFYDKPIGEIIEMAKTSDDIPNTTLERMSHQLQAGGLFESLKTRNPVVKQTFERMQRAVQESTHNIKTYLTDPKDGLKAYMRAMTPHEKGEIHSAMMLAEGQREFSTQDLRTAGFNDKQIAYYMKQRELDNKFYNDINERRVSLGMAPMDKRIAHIAGRFTGDFSRFVFDTDGKIVGRISGNTRGELNKVMKFMAEKNPDWKMGKEDYRAIGNGRSEKDRFGGLMEAINFISKTDTNASKLFDSYREYLQKDAINYLNATRSAKAKVKAAGGIKGSEGNKEWLSTIQNAEEGMKAQMAYYEQGFSWMSMEKAVQDLKPLLGNEDVIKQTPNAVDWANQYVDHALGRNQGKISDAMGTLISTIGKETGLGHSNFFQVSNTIKHLTMQKFMGLGNIPFSITQLMQPFQTTPAMIALLKGRGLEISAGDAQMKATKTYLNALMHEATKGKHDVLDAWEKSAMDYADKMGIVDVKMADHTMEINQRPAVEMYHKLADLNITIPERLTRGTAFLFYSHLLKDAGVPVKDIFGAAENMTNMTMVNYHPIERPMGYAKLGWMGDLASTLTRYKHNQVSQMAFYTREGIRGDNGIKSSLPMATFLATSLAFGGAMGFFGFQEADTAYQWVTEMMGKPDTLTNRVLSSGLPEAITHGVFSTVGLDMTTRFSNANVLPNSVGEAMMPYGSAVLDVAKSTGRFVLDPTSPTKFKQMLKSAAPQSVQGVMENQLFTEKQKDGRNLYINSTDGPNMGKGRVYRTEGEMSLRNYGFRNIGESKELAKNYSDGQINKANSNIVDSIMTKVKYDAMDGTLDNKKLATYIKRAANYGESPDSFVSKVTKWEEFRHLSQAQQQLLMNASSGFKGAMNIKQGR